MGGEEVRGRSGLRGVSFLFFGEMGDCEELKVMLCFC